MTYLDLFSGIGGFRLGLEMAGFKFSWEAHSDIGVYANKVYEKNFPNSVALGDITKIDPESLPQIDIVTAGFPCQDISVVGKQKGMKDGETRSGLFYEIIRICSVVRPRVLFMENVSNLLNGNDGEWMRAVLTALAEIGYDAEWEIIRASDVGALHRRARIWIVAYPNSIGKRTGCGGIQETNGEIPERNNNAKSCDTSKRKENVAYSRDCSDRANRRPEREKESVQSKHRETGCSGVSCGTSSNPEIMAYSDDKGLQGQHKSNRQRENRRQQIGGKGLSRGKEKVSNPQRKRQRGRDLPDNSWNESESKQGGNKGWGKAIQHIRKWPAEPNVGRVANGVPSRVDRLKCLGNAVVPQCVELVGRLILKSELFGR